MRDTSVSVIVTVKNEAGNIGRLISSLLAQTQPVEEIVIVDGGSTDGTAGIIEGFIATGAPIKLIVAEGCNISQGRNLAIKEASGEIIAATDAGVTLNPDWLASLLAGFGLGPHSVATPLAVGSTPSEEPPRRASTGREQQPHLRRTARSGGGPLDPGVNRHQENSPSAPSVDVVGGFFVPDCTTLFEVAMGATVLPQLRDVDPSKFLPSSRSVAFRRAAWEAVGGYPEWLDYCEDLVFDLNLKKAGYQFVFAPNAVAHFRPRGDLGSFIRQYYLYARGDGKAALWPKRHAVRYSTYLVFAPLALLLGFWYKVFWLLALLGAVAYLWRPYQRLLQFLPKYGLADKITAILLVPLIRVVGDVAKMVGYPVGVCWRVKNR